VETPHPKLPRDCGSIEHIGATLQSLVDSMLDKRASRRPTASQVCSEIRSIMAVGRVVRSTGEARHDSAPIHDTAEGKEHQRGISPHGGDVIGDRSGRRGS